MVLSNVIVDVTTLLCSFVFGQSCAKVSAGFTNVRSLAVAAFDLVYYQRLIWINIVGKKYNLFRFFQVYEFGVLGFHVLKKVLS